MFSKIRERNKKMQAIKQAKIRNEFLPEALEIVEKPVSPTGPLLLVIILCVVMFLGLWSVFGKMDEVVTARGIILTVSGVQEIQALNGGIIEEICVKEGEVITAGQAIVKIDSSINTINMLSIANSIELLEYENELLSKLMNDDLIGGEVEGNSEKQKIYAHVVAMKKAHESQKAELESNVEQMLSQITIEKEALDKLKKNRDFLLSQRDTLYTALDNSKAQQYTAEKLGLEIKYKEKQLSDYKKLFEAGAVAKVDVEVIEIELEQLVKELQIQNSLVITEDYDNIIKKAEIENQIILAEKDYNSQKESTELAEEKYNQTLDSLQTLEADFQSDIASMIVQNQNSITTQRANQEIQKITIDEQTLISPVDGIIKTLEINTIGGVVASSQTVATVVPYDSQMIVEINVQNRDIGYIKNGQEVVIKLDTFDFQEYGKLEGTVVFISPDAIWDDTYGWIYKAKIAINEESFKQRNPYTEIGVGMQCTAEVKVDERRIIEFFLEPIVEHFDGSLKIR